MFDERVLKKLEYNKIIERLADLASSEPGKEVVRSMVPSISMPEITRLMKETDDAVKLVVSKGSPPLGGIRDIRSIISRVALGAVLMPGELLAVSDVLRSSRTMSGYGKYDRIIQNNNCIIDIINYLYIDKTIENRINTCIRSEDEVDDNASPALSSVRRKIKSVQASIREKLDSIIKSSESRKYIQDAIITMREDRYVIPVKQEFRNEIPGLIHDSSSSGATLFIEPIAAVEANNEIKQLHIKEKREVEKILAELTQDVSQILDGLRTDMETLLQLDFIFARARLSIDYNCVSPILNNSGRIIIKKGRHPLLDKKNVVPIDLWVGDEFNALVVTGPNTGGKTVTLKTAGLFALMAQSGLHLPASDGTEISVFKQIFADIGDEQSIEQSLSTFSSHMTNIVQIINKVNPDSLVLLDELGAGTDPVEGAALAMSVIEYLKQVGAITIATTHYSELKLYALSEKGVENACCEFDVNTLRPTYRLLIGVPGKSNAFAISKRLGLGDDILNRATEFLSGEHIRFEDVLMTIEKNRRESEQEKSENSKLRRESEEMRESLRSQRDLLNEQRDKIIREAREQARKILVEAKEEAEITVKSLREIKKEIDEASIDREYEKLRLRLKNKTDELETQLTEGVLRLQRSEHPPRSLKEGDTVLIVNLNQKGTVLEPPGKNNEVLVQAGIMKINIGIDNLKLLEEKGQFNTAKGISEKAGISKSMSISREINVRGMTVDEAVTIIDKYLDDVRLSSLADVTVIHGKGTGALKNGIHRYLKKSAHVKAFRLGSFGEGDSGVTIVEIK